MSAQYQPVGRVLVVEDETEIRDFVAMVLGSEGYRVTTAPNGAGMWSPLPHSPQGFSCCVLRMSSEVEEAPWPWPRDLACVLMSCVVTRSARTPVRKNTRIK